MVSISFYLHSQQSNAILLKHHSSLIGLVSSDFHFYNYLLHHWSEFGTSSNLNVAKLLLATAQIGDGNREPDPSPWPGVLLLLLLLLYSGSCGTSIITLHIELSGCYPHYSPLLAGVSQISDLYLINMQVWEAIFIFTVWYTFVCVSNQYCIFDICFVILPHSFYIFELNWQFICM